ncbi:peptide-methionine (S)-S-oxide reductase MsrA [Hoeflea prorocentri]|uniref:Peptide methionine sulfoxide reductase MsrA n=1 Tax=Hoeflea prorocentri TaxID=1922333 RepID=A0A9X3ZJS9_9HYPH|nr:peptide-methionine (S)-S-oxide reductase MsrA [Hoeflea prorocentri]MCY6383413.1 peptide-methionine (S)-S-oxide reductase MsrA [Hoeflea prorocentri]MDA5401213.1 peptide-methionine (S)-S-oxide reductase MsrA [Hoeflea prorocentri]
MRNFLIAGTVAAAILAGLAAYMPMASVSAQAETPEDAEVAIFAGGCFWCVESDFDHVPGVVETLSGYTGGHLDNPTYKDVVTETTGHREAVKITYDPSKVSYAELLDIFFRSVDPTDPDGQFCDRGESYSTAIYTLDDEQKKLAEASSADAMKVLNKPIATRIIPASTFYPAEDYHQDYYLKNPIRYQYYRLGCRRDARVESLWGDEAHRGIDKSYRTQ